MKWTCDFFYFECLYKSVIKDGIEIDLLRQENARLVAKNYELKIEIVKLSQIIEKNASQC